MEQCCIHSPSSSITVGANVGGLGQLSGVAGRNWLSTHLNIPSVTLEHASRDPDLVLPGSLPFFSTPSFLLRSDDPVNGLLHGIDDNPVAVVDQCDWTPKEGLRYNMTDNVSSRGSREATVGDQRRLSTKAGTHQSTGWSQHLARNKGFRG